MHRARHVIRVLCITHVLCACRERAHCQLEQKWQIYLARYVLCAPLRPNLLVVALVTCDCIISAIHGSASPAELEAVRLHVEASRHCIRTYTDVTKKMALFRREN